MFQLICLAKEIGIRSNSKITYTQHALTESKLIFPLLLGSQAKGWERKNKIPQETTGIIEFQLVR